MKLRHLFFACSGVFVMMFSLLLLVVIVGMAFWASSVIAVTCLFIRSLASSMNAEANGRMSSLHDSSSGN